MVYRLLLMVSKCTYLEFNNETLWLLQNMYEETEPGMRFYWDGGKAAMCDSGDIVWSAMVEIE